MRPTLGILALLLTPPGTPSGGFHWQRTITPPAAAPTAQACVVLDAATFASAAPALRDLRLFQDGEELPYAIEESYDPRALETGTTTADDRSLYEPSVVATLLPGTAPGEPAPFKVRVSHPPKPGAIDPTLGFRGTVELPPHVPVERLRLEPAPVAPTLVSVVATEVKPAQADTAAQPATETIAGRVNQQQPALPLTLGANLQHPATLSMVVETSAHDPDRVIFEMRRRSLCYQPRSASPLTLYLGGGTGIAAKAYGYASSFSTALDRPYATLGPLVPNPDDTADHPHPANPRRKHLLWAATLAAACFVFSATRMLGKTKRPA